MKPYDYIYNIIDDIINQNTNTEYCYLCFSENIRFSKNEAENYAHRQYPGS